MFSLILFSRQVPNIRGGSRTAATSKMELFVVIVSGFQPLFIITKCSILDVAAVRDPPLNIMSNTIFLYLLSMFNPLQPSVAFLYPLKKIRKPLGFSDVFKGYRKATLGCNGLRYTMNFFVLLMQL